MRCRLGALGLLLGAVLATSASADDIELGSIRIVTPDGDLRGREFTRNLTAGLMAMRDKSPYLAQLLKAAQNAPLPITVQPMMEDPATYLPGQPYRPYTRAAGPRAVGQGGLVGYPVVLFLTLGHVNPYWSESKRGLLPHELVHAVDIAYGRIHPERVVRERRAVFMENLWRDQHGWPTAEHYFDDKLATFETLEYQRAKARGVIAQCVEMILSVTSFDCP